MSKTARHKRKPASPSLKEEHLKRYFEKLQQLFFCLKAEDIFDLLPPSIIKKLHKHRISPPQIVVDGKLPEGYTYLKEVKEDIFHLMKNLCFKNEDDITSITFYDALTIGQDLYGLLLREDEVFPEFEYLKLQMNRWESVLGGDNFVHNLMHLELMIDNMFSTVSSAFYRTNIESSFNKTGFLCLKFVLHEEHPVSIIDIEIDEKKRPVYQIGFWLIAFVPIYISAEQLGSTDFAPQRLFTVYIQQHALNRLNERLQLAPGLISVYLSASINEPDIFHMRKNSFLIAYRLDNLKVGYLETDLVGDKLIVRTFLLCTHKGTPEAMQLEAATGLCGLDIEYLNLTRLSAFCNSEIEQHPLVEEIFEDCGLMAMVEAANRFFFPNGKKRSLADNMEDYLNVIGSGSGGRRTNDTLNY